MVSNRTVLSMCGSCGLFSRVGTLLRYPYEVRDEKEYFDDIQDVKVTKDMLDLAKRIVNQKAADFDRTHPTKTRR
jgi:non-homologous end joining protein Ku